LIDGTDLKAVAEKRISVTPLHLDLTHNETLHRLKKTLGGVAPKKVEPIMGAAQ
jgi:5'-nucleotidase